MSSPRARADRVPRPRLLAETLGLPDEFQTDLNVPIVVDCIGNGAELRRPKCSIRSGELRRVQDVKELRPELQHTFTLRAKWKILERGEIEIHLAWSRRSVPAQVSERETRRQAENRGVKEPLQCALVTRKYRTGPGGIGTGV